MQHRTLQHITTRRTTAQRRTTQRRTELIGFVSSLLLTVGTAHADTTTFTGNGNPTGDWDVGLNWDNGIPGANDRAVIPAGKTCNITANAVADSIEVLASGQSVGTLVIEAGFTLTLDNDTDNVGPSGADNSVVDGEVLIEGSGAVLKFIDNDHGVLGNGKIDGTHDLARIDIEADIKLTSRIDITGQLTIKGLTGGTDNGKFRNDGQVIANNGENTTILLHGNTILEDHPTADQAHWIAEGCSTMKFDRPASLEGSFKLDDAFFHFSAGIRTCGTFTYNKAAVTIDSGNDFFAYKTYVSNTTCTNPGGTPSARDCTVWEISSTTSCGACGD